jgi:murein DD-endopeptidase MepM/ murein hydrolase activator NlpD
MNSRRSLPRIIFSALIILIIVTGYFVYRWYGTNVSRSARALAWLNNSASRSKRTFRAGERCGQAPFIFPTDGFIGYLWDDSFRVGHHHQGIDIFGGNSLNVTPVIAAYPGYLSRLPDWKSTVIIRIPEDPLNSDRQIWTYYTHMADEKGNSYISTEFPPDTMDVYVEAGTLLGYQGNFSGDPFNPTGVHLHFSIVKDDGRGSFLNELNIRNTLDPSPYLGLPLNAKLNSDDIPVCEGSVKS